MSVSDDPAFHLTNAVTLSAFVNPSSTAVGRIVGKWYTPDSYQLGLSAGRFIFSIALPGGTFGTGYSIYAPAVANQWAHVVGTFDGNQESLYINGVLKAQQNVSGVLQDSSMPIQIGNQPAWANFAGAIDDVRIYQTALTDAEVKNLWTQLDTTPPQTFFRTEDGTVLLSIAGDEVRGTAFDNLSGVGEVDVTFTPVFGPAERLTAILSCTDENRRTCTWSAQLPATAGYYAVTAHAIDRAGNTESSGAGPIRVLIV